MANSVTVGSTTYQLKFPPADSNGLNVMFNGVSPDDLETEYHFTDFNYEVEVQRTVPVVGTLETVQAKVTVQSFTLSYLDTIFTGGTPDTSAIIWVTGNTTLGDATLTLAGQHQGVFERNQWHVRNAEFDFIRQYNTTDDRDEFRGAYEVGPDYITIERSRAAIREELPQGYYAGFKFTPDRTLSTSITWSITLQLTGGGTNTSLTFTNITQTVRNDWSKYLREIREFVYEGKEEGAGITRYNQGGEEVQLVAPVFTVENRTTPGSAALITVTTAQAHGLFAGNQVLVTITSTATNHSLAQGSFNVLEVPSATSLIYSCTSTGTINTTSSLLGSIRGYRSAAQITLPVF